MELDVELMVFLASRLARARSDGHVHTVEVLARARSVLGAPRPDPGSYTRDGSSERLARELARFLQARIDRAADRDAGLEDCRASLERLIRRVWALAPLEPAGDGGDGLEGEDCLEGERGVARALADLFPGRRGLTAGDRPRDVLGPWAPGGRLGDFEILAPLGRGGMGAVYRAWQFSLRREVALKVLPPAGPEGSRHLERFLREAKAAARVSHANVAGILGAGIEDGRPWIAMQLVRGPSLDQVLLEGGRLPVERALAIARDVARALEAAHAAGVLHRDLKPGNVLVEGDTASARAGGRVYLTDFGLATFAEAETLTVSGEILGTPAYMAPEQARGEKLAASADIYSLGATLYALLSGRAPHEGSSHAEVLARVAREDPIPLRRLVPSLDRDAALICEKAMRWVPRQRYATAGELAEDIERRLEHRPIRARPARWTYRASLWLRRNPRAVKTACAVLVLASIALAVERTWRRSALLDEVERDLRAWRIDEAKGKLKSLPRIPGVSSEAEELELWARAHLALPEFGDAVRVASGMSRERRERFRERLEPAVDDEIHDAEILLRAGVWLNGLRSLWNVAGALEHYDLLEARDGGKWRDQALHRAEDLALAALLQHDLDPPAVEVIEARISFCAPLRAARLRDLLARTLGIPQDDSVPRAQKVDSILARLLARVAASGITNPAALAPRELTGYLELLDRLLPFLPPREVQRVQR